ncbi:MAG: T9SS type A sorting domain-containing protein [Bacteroidetes bacterium]|nr:T9SS type A sorting domain-containing protein [Bacteroidota bacterium]
MKTLKPVATVLAGIILLLLAIALWSDAPVRPSQLNPLTVQSEESKLVASTQGHPDEFFQYHHDIRASADGTNDYPMGYRLKEFKKILTAAKTPSAKLNWVERGPGNVGGRTRALLVDPNDPQNTWWAGSVSGGLWKTTDRGSTWQPVTDNLPNLAVGSLAMAESDPNVIYMGTGEGVGMPSSVAGDGIFKSVDRGTTWNHLSATAGNANFRFVNQLAVDPTNSNVVSAATSEGIFQTVDGGVTWTASYRSPSEDEPVHDLRAQPSNFDRQIASVGKRGILYSNDAGVTWTFASVDWASEFYRIELVYSPSDPDIAYAAVHAWITEGDFRLLSDLYRSEDGGMNWVRTLSHSGINWFGGQGWFNNTLAVHPFKPDTVFVGGIELWQNTIIGGNALILVSDFDYGGSDKWLEFKPVVDQGVYHRIEERVVVQHPDAVDVSLTDYTDIEIRWGQGTQLAHRFWVEKTAGPYQNGGIAISFSKYMYADYVEVPFQVWDTKNNRQLMVSFRDQADDGEFNLIRYDTHYLTPRDDTSMEYIFIHKYDYNAMVPHNNISRDGGLVSGMLYMLHPVLVDDSTVTWDPANLPNQTISASFELAENPRRDLDDQLRQIDVDRTTHVDHHAIVPIPINEGRNEFWILNANDGGVALSTNNGQSFIELDRAGSGYNTMQVYGVAKKPGASVYIAGAQDNGTWKSSNNPSNRVEWTEEGVGDGFETVWHATDPDKIMASEQFAIGRTTDGGATWEGSFSVENEEEHGQFMTQIASSDKAPDDVYTVEARGVWYSRDFGENWDLTLITEAWERWAGCKVRVSIADPNVVWAGCGLISSPSETKLFNKLQVSQDRGESFEATAFPVMSRPPETYVSGLATHPVEKGTAYALFSRYNHPKILETKDYGQTWTDLSGFATSDVSTNGFPDVAVFDLVVMPHATNVLWVGTEIGLFESRNYGVEWNYADNGLPAVSVWRIKIRDDEVVLGTHGRGVWTVPIGEIATGITDEPDELPSEFSLSQNYPNPFNASTAIQFKVPNEVQVRLIVFDAVGRKVSVLTDQVYSPGVHQVDWDANAYASGVYFYRMESEGKLIYTQAMTLLK